MLFQDKGWNKAKQGIESLNGKKIEVGLLAESGQENVNKAFWNHYGTSDIPARPFVDAPVNPDSSKTMNKNKRAVKAIHKGESVESALQPVQDSTEESIRKKAINMSSPGNAESTIAQKGFDDPLIDSGAMVFSVTSKVTG